MDGTEITEAVSTLIHLSRSGYKTMCFAPDGNQEETYDHATKAVEKNEVRDMAAESSRISRVPVRKLNTLKADAYHALIIPGGFGVAKGVIADFQLHLHLRVLGEECAQGRADVSATETQRRVDPNQAFGCGPTVVDQLLDLIDLRQDPGGVGKQQLTFRGQAHGARGAIDQADAQSSLQRGETLADRRRRDTQFPCGRGETAFIGQEIEKRQIEGLAHS